MNKRGKGKSFKVRKEKQSPKCEVQHKTFWALMGIFFLVSFIFLINTLQENSNLTGRVAIQTISYAFKGSDLSFEVRNVLNVKDFKIRLAEDVKNGKLEFKEKVNPKFEGIAISGFYVSKNDVVQLSSIEITLKVKEADIIKKGLSNAEVKLYLDGELLDTRIMEVKEGYVFYQASASRLGEFVIGKAREREAEVIVSKNQEAEAVKPIEQQPLLEKPRSIVEGEKNQLIGEAIAIEKEQKGFFGSITDFFKGLFN
ncbi:hypothetical protein HYX11_00630 [Candidatus Woesearchaeota archaeon]|nr:hypothetical protein [Candidatus Woesearchaeota archaeon]